MSDKFVEHLESQNYSRKSIKIYNDNVKRFFSFIKDKNIPRIQDVTLQDIESYQADLIEHNLSINSIDVYIRALKQYFKFIELQGVIFENPMENLKRPKIKNKIRFVPSVKSMIELIDGIDTITKDGIRNRAIIETLYSCGLRLNELLGVTLHDVDFRNQQIRIYGKGRKERMLPLTKQAVLYIQKYLDEVRPNLVKNIDENYLWVSNYGNRLSERALQRIVSELARKAGLKYVYTVHTIRRACATHLLQNGAEPLMIQELLGHSNLKSLSQYLKLSIRDIKKMHKESRLGK